MAEQDLFAVGMYTKSQPQGVQKGDKVFFPMSSLKDLGRQADFVVLKENLSPEEATKIANSRGF